MTMDDPFDDIVSGLEIEFPQGVEDVTKLETVEIIMKITEIEDTLFQSGQALNPSNQVARDLHSTRNALQLELRKRGKI